MDCYRLILECLKPPGSTLVEFTWSTIADDTPGAVNVGQTFSGAIPEPSTYALLFGGLALGFVAWRKRQL